MKKTFVKSSSWKYAGWFAAAIILGILNGLFPTELGLTVARFLSDVFVRLFKFISVPIIAVTICYTMGRLGSAHTQKTLWKRTLGYTLSTTLIAAGVGAVLYYFFTPANVTATPAADAGLAAQKGYLDYFISVIPDNPLAPLVQGNVLSVLIIALAVGVGYNFGHISVHSCNGSAAFNAHETIRILGRGECAVHCTHIAYRSADLFGRYFYNKAVIVFKQYALCLHKTLSYCSVGGL